MIVAIIKICVLVIVFYVLGWYMWHLFIERIYININNYFYKKNLILWKESVIKNYNGCVVHFNFNKILPQIKTANQLGVEVKMGKDCEAELMKLDIYNETLKYKLSIEDDLLLIGDKLFRFKEDFWIEKK